MSDDRREKGRAKFEEVMGFAPPDTKGDPFLDTTIEHLFANIWSRGELSLRERRLISLTILTCLGNEMALKLHLTAALKKDLSAEDVDEMMLHITHYAGWPVGAFGFSVARQMKR